MEDLDKKRAGWRDRAARCYRKNKEKILARNRMHRKKNKDRYKALARYRTIKNKEKIRAQNRMRYEKNKDKINTRQRAWYAKNKEWYARNRARRRISDLAAYYSKKYGPYAEMFQCIQKEKIKQGLVPNRRKYSK